MVKLPTPDFWKFDKRSLERTLFTKKTPLKEIKTHLDSLPDDAANVEMVSIWDEKLELPSKRLPQRDSEPKPE